MMKNNEVNVVDVRASRSHPGTCQGRTPLVFEGAHGLSKDADLQSFLYDSAGRCAVLKWSATWAQVRPAQIVDDDAL